MNRNRAFLLLLLLVVGLSGCPRPAPPVEYHLLETGIRMTEWQIALQQEYLELYQFVDEDQQKFMEENIAPALNRAKKNIANYNDAVLRSETPEVPIDDIRTLLRHIAFQLSRVEVEDAH